MSSIEIAIFALAAFLALVMLVVNERFGYGAPESWLSMQALFLIGGTVFFLQGVQTEFALRILPLLLSDMLGVVGFLIIYFLDEGPKRFTKPLLPGLKS